MSFASDGTTSISLIEFIDEIRGIALQSPEQVADAVPLFTALNANRKILVDHVTTLLQNLQTADFENEYTGQTFVIHQTSSYFIRANVWLPRHYETLSAASESDQFFYGLPHDHNFTFMTAGHFGSGYLTKIFEYDGRGCVAKIGDPVSVRFLEETRLSEKKILIFRASQDIHIQYQPDEFSISLNLMTRNSAEQAIAQRIFDEDLTHVTEEPAGKQKQLSNLFAIAATIGDGNTEDVLVDLEKSKDPEIQSASSACLKELRLGHHNTLPTAGV